MLKRSLQLLFYAVALELILGGGGRLTAIGPVSLRMVLFAGAVVATGIYLFKFKERLPNELLQLMAAFSGMLVVGIGVGIMNGSEPSLLWEDVKPLLYFFLLPFIYFSITDVKTLSNIFKYSSVGMAIVFITILLLIHTGIMPFLSFYHTVIDTGEFFFRGEITFFYKGFLYLCIGFIFLLQDQGKKWQIVLVLLAIILTVTRGFWLALLLTYGSYYLIFSKRKIRGTFLIVFAIILLVYGQDLIATVSKTVDTREAKPYLLGDRTHSDNDRIRTITQVMERGTSGSAVIGHGFGQGIPIRPIHMEISYLEIFHKQGVIGLIVWLLIFIAGVKKFIHVKDDAVVVALFLSFVFVFVQSLSNQFINNPIGLFMIITTLAILEKKIPRGAVPNFSSQLL